MTTIKKLEDLHLHRLQLFAYCSIGQTLLQKFLIKETLGLSNNRDPCEALSEVLGQNKDQLKNLKNIFVSSSTTDLIYEDIKNVKLKPSINILKLDTSALVELLSRIDVFKTSYKYTHDVKCKGKKHSCCNKCCHKCTHCDKNDCAGGKCCLATLKCDHACSNCGTKRFVCKNNAKVCCGECKLCLGCYLSSTKQPTVEKLVRSGKLGTICQTQKLKISVNMLSKIRNLTMHLTNEECSELDASHFSSSDFPGFNNWNNLNTIITEVLKVVLQYVCPSTTMEEDIKGIEDIEKLTDKEELLRIYEEKIRIFGTFEHLLEIKEDLKQIGESVQRLHLENKRLTFHVEFFFNENLKYNLDCEVAINIREVMKSRIKILFEDRYKLIDNGLVANQSSNTQTITLEFQVKATSEANDLSVYEENGSEQSKELWKNIYDCIKDKIPNLDKVERTWWKLGSVIIGVALYKSHGSYWSKEERESIDKLLPVICFKLNKQYTRRLIFSCQVIPIQDGHDDLKTLSFEIVSDDTDKDKDQAVKGLLTRVDSSEMLWWFPNISALVNCPIDCYMVGNEKGGFYAQFLRASYSLLNISLVLRAYHTFWFERGRKWLEVFSRKYNPLMELLSRTDFVGEIKIIKLVIPKTKTDTKRDKPSLEYHSFTKDYLEVTMSDKVDMRQKMTDIKYDKPFLVECHSSIEDDLESMKMMSQGMTGAKNDKFDKDTTGPPLTGGDTVYLDDEIYPLPKVKPKTGQKFILSPPLKNNLELLQNHVEKFVNEIYFHDRFEFSHLSEISNHLKKIIQEVVILVL